MSDPVVTYFGIKLSIMQGATAGGILAVILGQGQPMTVKLSRGIGGVLFAVFATEGFLEFASRWITITPAVDRLGGLVFGITGIVFADALMKIVSQMGRRAPDILEKKITGSVGDKNDDQ